MAKFSTTAEIKRTLNCIKGNIFDHSIGTAPYSGPVLMYNSMPFKEIYTDSSESHVGIVGSTGYGKSRRAFSASVLTAIRERENILIMDTKPEHMQNFSSIAEKHGYRIVIMDLGNPHISAGYNPLKYVDSLYRNGDKDTAYVELKKAVQLIMPKDRPVTDPFWTISAVNILYGFSLALMECADEKQVNFASLLRLINDCAHRDSDGQFVLTKLLKTLPEDSVISDALEDYSNTALVTSAGMRSNAVQMLQQYVFSDGLNAMLSNNDVKIGSVGNCTAPPVIYFVILPEQNEVLSPIASLFFTQLVNRYIRVADSQPDGRLPERLNIFIDELPALAGVLADSFPRYMSTCRSRNIRIYYVIQSFEQLAAGFGNSAKTILDNTGTMIVFRINTETSARYVTDMLGRYEYTNRYSGEIITREVMTASDICSMDIGQAAVITNSLKFITWLPDYTEIIPESYTKLPKLPLKARKRKATAYFNVKNYLEKTKQPAPVRNVGNIKKQSPDIISGVSLEELMRANKPEIYIGDYQDNSVMNETIDKLYTSFCVKGCRKEVLDLIKTQVNSFTKRRLQHKYKVSLICMGHKTDFIAKAARICKVDKTVMVNMLYPAIDEPVEYFFETHDTAEDFALAIEESGGVAELFLLYDN